jgi:hypothetical protein
VWGKALHARPVSRELHVEPDVAARGQQQLSPARRVRKREVEEWRTRSRPASRSCGGTPRGRAPWRPAQALSGSLLGEELENRRVQLRATLPIGRVVGPADVAALAVHVMSNTALTGATYDVDGGQQLLAG